MAENTIKKIDINGRTNLALAGVSFSIFISFLQVQKLDIFLYISLACFVIIFPINVLIGVFHEFLADRTVKDYKQKVDRYSNFIVVIGVGSIVLAFIGISSLICHFCNVFGYVFAGISLLFFIIFFVLKPNMV